MSNRIGQIQMNAFKFDTDSWIIIKQQVSTEKYPELYALLGHAFNKEYNIPIQPGLFALPDVQDEGDGDGGTVRSFIQASQSNIGQSDVIGEVIQFSASNIPEGWLPCGGQALEIAQYQELFSIVGYRFSKNPNNGKTFNLPSPPFWHTSEHFICCKGEYPVTVQGYMGSIRSSVYNNDQNPLRDCLPCDGRALNVKENEALFSLLGYRFGGSGNSFNIPLLTNQIEGVTNYICTNGVYPQPVQ